MLRTVIHCHCGRAVGLGLFFLGSLAYRSQNRDVFGLWSWPFLAIVVITGVIFFVAVVHSLICSRRLGTNGYQPSGSFIAEMAFVMWGGGYFLNALDAPKNWAQIAELNAFGSSNPVAALLLWIALLLAVLSLAASVVPRGRTSKCGAAMLATWVTIIILLLIEGGIRISAIVSPQTQGYPSATNALWFRKYVSLNQSGFRDIEHALTPSRRNLRLLVVGDSLAFGWGLSRVEDRFGEQLVRRLNERTGAEWETLNASRGDTDTIAHIEFLKAMQVYQPDVILLLYAFNDMDYLAQVTPRDGPSEYVSSFLRQLSPDRVLFKNLYLFQETYVRLRAMTYRIPTGYKDPYEDDALLNVHFRDLSRFVSLASESNAVVAIVPFDVKVVASPDFGTRYDYFIKLATAYGLPIWPVGQNVFSMRAYKDLVVNKLDSHPNALANRLLADSIADRVLVAWGQAEHGRQ